MIADTPLLDIFFDACIRRILFSKISFLILWYFLVQVTNHQKFRVTMAAIDPSDDPSTGSHRPRCATLKLVRKPIDDDDESDEDYDDVDAIRARLAGAISDEEDEDEEFEEDEDSDEEKNGGPSDPARSRKARKEAAIKKLLEEEEMDLDNAPNGVNSTKANKGKGKATDLDEDSSEDEDEDLEGEMEEFVICTLSPDKVRIRSLSSRLNPHLFTNFLSELSTTS